jgi:hypothetical protein
MTTSIKAMATSTKSDPMRVGHLVRLVSPKKDSAWGILAFDIVASLGIGQRKLQDLMQKWRLVRGFSTFGALWSGLAFGDVTSSVVRKKRPSSNGLQEWGLVRRVGGWRCGVRFVDLT